MCGRYFQQRPPAEIAAYFEAVNPTPNLAPNWNRAPTQDGLVLRRHPETGEEALYVDEVYAVGIDGMTEEESRPLLDFLCRHATQHGFTCRLRWAPGMVALWDNRSTLHLAANDYDGFRREMYRTTMEGERPE